MKKRPSRTPKKKKKPEPAAPVESGQPSETRTGTSQHHKYSISFQFGHAKVVMVTSNHDLLQEIADMDKHIPNHEAFRHFVRCRVAQRVKEHETAVPSFYEWPDVPMDPTITWDAATRPTDQEEIAALKKALRPVKAAPEESAPTTKPPKPGAKKRSAPKRKKRSAFKRNE